MGSASETATVGAFLPAFVPGPDCFPARYDPISIPALIPISVSGSRSVRNAHGVAPGAAIMAPLRAVQAHNLPAILRVILHADNFLVVGDHGLVPDVQRIVGIGVWRRQHVDQIRRPRGYRAIRRVDEALPPEPPKRLQVGLLDELARVGDEPAEPAELAVGVDVELLVALPEQRPVVGATDDQLLGIDQPPTRRTAWRRFRSWRTRCCGWSPTSTRRRCSRCRGIWRRPTGGRSGRRGRRNSSVVW